MSKILSKLWIKLFVLFFVGIYLLYPRIAVASQAVTGELSNLPIKNVIVDNETFDGFTSSLTNIGSSSFKDAYQLPIKYSKNNSSSVHLNSIIGASGKSGDYAMQMYNSQPSATHGSYILFALNGNVESTSRIKNDRVIFEMDTMLSQLDADIQMRKFLGDSFNYTLFNNDGTIGVEKSHNYVVNEWKHLLIDLDFPNKLIAFYYDGTLVSQIELTTTQSDNGCGNIQFNIISPTINTAAFAFDNLNVYTVAPYSEATGYAVGSDEYGAIDNVAVPNTADKLILPLSGAFKTASNVKSYVSLKRDGVKVDGASVAYTANTKTDEYVITITLAQALTAGDYVIEYASELIMEQQIGTATSTEITLENSYHQSIKVVEPNKITLTTSADSAYNAEIYYDSEESDTVTMIIAAYENDNGMTSLSSVAYDEFDVGIGINKIILYHTDSSADYVKAMLWSDVMETAVPLTDAVFLNLE